MKKTNGKIHYKKIQIKQMTKKENTENRMLIRSYLYNKEKKYQKDLEDRNNYENKINKNSEKIHYIYNDVINNKINKEINYNSFLQEIIKMNQQIEIVQTKNQQKKKKTQKQRQKK